RRYAHTAGSAACRTLPARREPRPAPAAHGSRSRCPGSIRSVEPRRSTGPLSSACRCRYRHPRQDGVRSLVPSRTPPASKLAPGRSVVSRACVPPAVYLLLGGVGTSILDTTVRELTNMPGSHLRVREHLV